MKSIWKLLMFCHHSRWYSRRAGLMKSIYCLGIGIWGYLLLLYLLILSRLVKTRQKLSFDTTLMVLSERIIWEPKLRACCARSMIGLCLFGKRSIHVHITSIILMSGLKIIKHEKLVNWGFHRMKIWRPFLNDIRLFGYNKIFPSYFMWPFLMLTILLFLDGCASSNRHKLPDVFNADYKAFNCERLEAELNRVDHRVSEFIGRIKQIQTIT